LEIIFRQLDIKPLVFGSFAEMSSNTNDFVEMALEYGVEHLGTIMIASTPEVLIVALRRQFRAQLSMSARREYASLVLDRTKYFGTGKTGTNMAQIR
jgi:hypothetical protein